MNEFGFEEQIAAAMGYDDLFVPALFEEWAPRVADAARVRPGDRVLDVACGTGVLTRAARVRAGAAGFVVGLDINPGMLEVAARRNPDITWRQGTAESIPFADGSFDAVVSQFGLMFVPDPRQAVREMWRVLADGGRLAVAVWDSLENTPAYSDEVDLLHRMVGETAADILRAPFALGDPDRLRGLFHEAGIPSPVLRAQRGRGRFPSIRTMLAADLEAWLPLANIVLSEEQVAAVQAEGERVFSKYVKPDGTVEFDAPAHIVTATK